MKKALNRVIRCLLYSNVFISICAMAFVAEAYLLLDKQIKYDALMLLCGTSTLFTYMLIRLAAIKRISRYEPDQRWQFFLSHLQLVKIVTAISFIACIVLFFLVKRNIQLALIIPGMISVIYGLPLGKKFRLRDVGIIKIFLISFVWAFISSVLPAVNSGMDLFSTEPLVLFAANYLFIFGITLPFDLKDLKVDVMNDVKTIPGLLGEDNTYTLSFLCLFASAAIHVFLQRSLIHNALDYAVPLSISILITGLLIYASRRKEKNNFIYFGLIDGMILLQFLLCWSYQCWNT